jgi:hypothetical protein
MLMFNLRLTPRHFTAQLLETQRLPDLASGQILKDSPKCFCLWLFATTRFKALNWTLICEKSGCGGNEGFAVVSVEHHSLYQAFRF